MTTTEKEDDMTQGLFGTPEHELFRETVCKFTEEELRPRAREFDKMGRIDKSLFKHLIKNT